MNSYKNHEFIPPHRKTSLLLARDKIIEYEIKPYLFACWRVYDILRIFVPGPKHPLANKLFDMFGVNHGLAHTMAKPSA